MIFILWFLPAGACYFIKDSSQAWGILYLAVFAITLLWGRFLNENIFNNK
jgi:hypothetical protein